MGGPLLFYHLYIPITSQSSPTVSDRCVFRLDSVHLDDAVVLLDLLLWSSGSPKNANWGNGNFMGKLMDFVYGTFMRN
jgi:cell shape-determining protein MreD